MKINILCVCLYLIVITFFESTSAWAASEYPKRVGNYYSCRLEDNGNNTSKATLSIDYMAYRGDYSLTSRAIAVVFYNFAGKPIGRNLQPNSVSLDGVKATTVHTIREVQYYRASLSNVWKNNGYFAAEIVIDNITNKYFKDWQAMSVGLADQDSRGDFYVNNTGVAYLTFDKTTDSCWLVEPEDPPPPEQQITFNFDLPQRWDLKAIKPGKSVINLSGTGNNPFCINYNGMETADNKFILMVNSDSEKNNTFNLRNQNDVSKEIHYQLRLNDGIKVLRYPAIAGRSYSFDKNATQVCFLPIFDIDAGSSPQVGNYKDVLNFNIIVKP